MPIPKYSIVFAMILNGVRALKKLFIEMLQSGRGNNVFDIFCEEKTLKDKSVMNENKSDTAKKKRRKIHTVAVTQISSPKNKRILCLKFYQYQFRRTIGPHT